VVAFRPENDIKPLSAPPSALISACSCERLAADSVALRAKSTSERWVLPSMVIGM
jgi:hypothetical protein